MTELLQKAIAEIKKLPREQENAIANIKAISFFPTMTLLNSD